MNRLFSILSLIVLATITLGVASCSKDNNEDEPTLNDIVGTWKIAEVSTNDGVSFSSWPFQETTATFNSDGTYTGKGYFGNGSGTWKQNGTKITTYVGGKEYIAYTVKELTSLTCTLVMSQTGSDATIWVKCIKTTALATEGTAITQEELNKVSAYCYDDGSSKLYIKFRNGHLRTKQVSESLGAYNQDDIEYVLDGTKLTLSFNNTTYTGHMYKVARGGVYDLLIQLDGNSNFDKWLSKTFKITSYQF